MRNPKQIAKAPGTSWTTWVATLLGVAITLTPLMSSDIWKMVVAVIILVIAAFSIVRDYWLQQDRRALKALVNDIPLTSIDKWTSRFDTLKADYHAQKDEVGELEKAWQEAEQQWNWEHNLERKKVLLESKDFAKRNWRGAEAKRDASAERLNNISNNLERLTGVLLSVENIPSYTESSPAAES